jgi:hypothetical protein
VKAVTHHDRDSVRLGDFPTIHQPRPAPIFFLRPVVIGGMAESAELRKSARSRQRRPGVCIFAVTFWRRLDLKNRRTEEPEIHSGACFSTDLPCYSA